jgi:thiol-disulfide isomerase/thioredoxin
MGNHQNPQCLPIYCLCRFRNIAYPIYVDEKSTSDITINTSGLKVEFSFNGTFSSINNYLQAKHQRLDSLLFANNLEKNYAMTLARFKLLNQQLMRDFKQLRSKYLPGIELDNRFKQYDDLDIASFVIIRKILYADYHYYFTQEKIPIQYSLDTLEKDISFDNELGLSSANFTNLLSMYMNHQLRQNKISEKLGVKEQNLMYFSQKYNLAMSLFRNNDIVQFFVSETLLGSLDLGLNDFFDEKLKMCRAFFSNTKYLDFAILKSLALQSIRKGSKAANFEMINTKGTKLTLEDFRGKNIFINVWSFGCLHSVKELAHLNKTADQFDASKNIVFLNIYLGEDKAEWLKYNIDKPLKGINVMLKDTQSTFSNSYFINSLPRYILIDRLGKIMNPFTERPSSPSLVKELNELDRN